MTPLLNSGIVSTFTFLYSMVCDEAKEEAVAGDILRMRNFFTPVLFAPLIYSIFELIEISTESSVLPV